MISSGSNASQARALHTHTQAQGWGSQRGVGGNRGVGFAGRGNVFAPLHKLSCDHRLARVILCAVMKLDERSPACR